MTNHTAPVLHGPRHARERPTRTLHVYVAGDLVQLRGVVVDQVSAGGVGWAWVVLSDGTALALRQRPDGVWRIGPATDSHTNLRITPVGSVDGHDTTDEATVCGDIGWVLVITAADTRRWEVR